jgi:glycerol-3-phosphate O-acyltransferase / dihydroxyacetone phosphate acyltransferase
VTGWLHALAVATFLAVWLTGLLDLSRRPDLPIGRRVAWAVVMLLVPTIGAAAYVLARPVQVEQRVVGDDASSAATIGTQASPPDGPRGARAVQRFAGRATRGLFRSVEVVRPADLAPRGPQLWCISHFGALSDPIVLLHALERPPRFLAGDFLWRVPVLRRTLDAVRAIPVRRTQDGGGAGNLGMFAASVEALADGDLVAIFPEGVATEGAQVSPLRTGAARVALHAVDAGVHGVAVVPAGIHYQDRAALRHRVFVDVGEALDLDAWCDERAAQRGGGSVGLGVGPRTEDRAMVLALTDELDRRLRGVAPQFADLEQAHALHTAAAVALGGDRAAPPSWGRQAQLAADVGRAPAEARAAVVDAVVGYREALAAAGLSDAEVVARSAAARRHLVATTLLGLLLLPFALLGALLHAPLALLVAAAGRLRVAPPTLATILPVVGLVGALLTWGLTAWWLSGYGPVVLGDATGWPARTLAVLQWLLVLPMWGWAALAVGERLASARRALRTRRRRGRSTTAAVLPAMREQRAEVVARIEQAVRR